MKQIVFILLLVSSLLLSKENAEITYAKKLPRQDATGEKVLLSYSGVLEQSRKTVVNIATQKSVTQNGYANPFLSDPLFREFFYGLEDSRVPQERVERSLGSGVIISKNGYIVTNNHVVDGAEKIVVNLAGEQKEYEATLIGKDPKSDLAIIKIEAKNLEAITFYNSDDVKVGDVVFALGNPFAVGETVTQGIVSATRRSSVGIVEYEDFIQTDASINPGNSGGALINSAGYLIGINSAIISRSGGNVGIGFAIPSNMVEKIATALITNGEFQRAYLGVRISDVSDDMSLFYDGKFGALITSIEEGTPAQTAGLKRGDLIMRVNDKAINSASELKNVIGSFAPDATIMLDILRDKKTITKKVNLTTQMAKKQESGTSYKGISVAELTLPNKQEYGVNDTIQGVVVREIAKDSAAQKLGVFVGDIIVQIENKEIKNLKDFQNATIGEEKKRIYIYRRGAIFAVVL
ncbi:MAG: Do family serine endopeptidase [Sulfurimonadaceae bacterium]|jgi:serine protease Do|nr:Do family serine endopeptidase [Sulfurimonadaceae bacterium]